MRKFKLIIFDLFFIISAVLGVGFATGKEIEHFFVGGRSVWIAVGVFFVVFVIVTMYILYIKHKHNIVKLSELNKLAFGKHYEWVNILLIIMFVVTNSAMLSGCDNILNNVFGIKLPIGSLFLSIITFFIVLGGINRIKGIANMVMPVLVAIVITNACFNIKSIFTLQGSMVLDMVYPIIFCCENFITIISVLIKTKSSPKTLSVLSGLILSIVILISALSIANVGGDMPLLATAKNLGNVFYVIYLISVLFALFTTLQISSYNCLEISMKSKRQKYFITSLILLASQSLSYLGFTFIVQYLYSFIGILGGIYLIILIICLIVMDRKFK